MSPLNNFRSICSHVRDPHIRLMLEEWALKNIQELRIECRIDRQDEIHDRLEYEQENMLHRMVHEIVKKAHVETSEAWMQGDQRIGKIITKSVHIVGKI